MSYGQSYRSHPSGTAAHDFDSTSGGMEGGKVRMRGSGRRGSMM